MTVAFDFETYLISKEYPYPKPVCVSSYNGWNKKLLVGKDMEDHLKYILSTKSVAHNAIFECGVIYKWFPNLRKDLFLALSEGRIICTQIMQEIYNARSEKPVPRTSLANLVLEYFEEDISESKKDPNAWRLRYSELDGVPREQWPEEAVEYAVNDSIWAFKLHKRLLSDQIGTINTKRAVEASFYLNMAGKIGIKIDQERVSQLESEIYEILNPKYETLIKKGFCTDIGAKRPKKNMKVFREYIKDTVKNVIYSPKGTIKTDLEALLAYEAETEDEVFRLFRELNDYDKVLTAFVSRLKGSEHIMTDYSTTKSTGRTSSRTSRSYPSVNIQQMPRKVPNVTWDVRNCFIPREGYKLVSIDYSGLELASAATQLFKVFGYSEMRNMLNSGNGPVDLHSMLAAKIMSIKMNRNIDYDHFCEHKKEGKYAEMRQLCKAINLGFPGGIGYDNMRKILLQNGIKTKFAILETSMNRNYLNNLYYNLKFEEPNLRIKQLSPVDYALVYDELVGLKKNMFKVYPELERFLKERHKYAMTGETKWVKDEFEQWKEEPMYKYKVGDFERDWCVYTAYCNGFLMQTPSAIGATQMFIELGKKYLGHQDVNLLAFIHDEVLFEVRGDIEYNVQNIAEIMIDRMAKMLKGCRIAVEASVMDYWSKDGGQDTVYWKDAKNNELRSL